MKDPKKEEKRHSLPYRILRDIFRIIPMPGVILFPLRKWVRRTVHGDIEPSYTAWVKNDEVIDSLCREKLKDQIVDLAKFPLFSIITVCPEEDIPLFSLYDSLAHQIYGNWELLIIGRKDFQSIARFRAAGNGDGRLVLIQRDEDMVLSRSLTLASEKAKGDYLAFLDPKDVLSDIALAKMAMVVNENPKLKLIYSDEDCVDSRGQRHSPFFKPDWSPELLLSQNYIGKSAVFDRERFMECISFREETNGAEGFNRILRFSAGIDPTAVAHIPKILVHVFEEHPFGKAPAISEASRLAHRMGVEQKGLSVLQNFLDDQGIEAKVEIGSEGVSYQVRQILSRPPKVSIVIPSTCKLKVLNPCLLSLLGRTTYPDFEILLVVNEIRYDVPEQSAFLNKIGADPRVRVLVYKDQPFNYSKVNNWAIGQSKGSVLCLLNDDTEILTPDWLEEMVSIALRQNVGAVGAKLSYPNGRIQHGGVIVGTDWCFHAFRFVPEKSGGYWGRLFCHCNYSAVTGACLVVRKDRYFEVGGLDESLAIAFNDIDFCLKLQSLGYWTVWTPRALLIHKESISRGYDDTPEKEEIYRRELCLFSERWSQLIANGDPFYNPNLTLVIEDFSLSATRQKNGHESF